MRVSDTGAGMTPDVIEHALEPFFTTKLDGTGTGLGLAAVCGIIAQAEGSIQVTSAPGVGTTFALAFPVVTSQAHAGPAGAAVKRKLKGETVLVAEDEAALRESQGGFSLATATR